MTDPVTEPAAEPVTDPVTEPEAEPVTDPEAEPVTDPVTDPGAEPEAEPVTDPLTEPEADWVGDPTAAPVTDPEPEPAEADLGVADFHPALVSTVTVELPNQHATVVLRETDSPRRHLSFAIGLPDAVALSHALRRITTPRPLTHELMTEVLEAAEVDLVAVRLVGRRGAVYFAELDVRSRAGRSVHACRPSDGLTLALSQKVPVPVLVDRRLFEESGDVEPI